MSSDPIKRYEKLKQIGKGSYGKVYLMRDKQAGELVVVKTIPIKNKDTKSKAIAEKEARVLAMLQHPNIIMYLGSFFNRRGDFCIVLEYADGKDLQRYLENHGEIDEKQVLQIFTQIILGLDYIHSQNILHRDIKTANVFLFRKGLVKLGDFGIAREVNNDELAHTLIGTPYFMCPELIKGQSYGFPADIWAAGCVLFELLARKHAFTGKSREELFANIMSGQMPQMPNQYSKQLTDLLRQMLNQDPAKRPSCKDILATEIIGQGLDSLQSKLTRHFGGKSNVPTSSHRTPRNQRNSNRNTTERLISQSNSFDQTDDELDQQRIPTWLQDNNPNDNQIGEELVRQSFKHLEKDASRLLGVVRSSISRKSIRAIQEVSASPMTITGNLKERKARLEEDARRGLGDKYELAYNFIHEYGQENREQLLSLLGLVKVPERELRMIETITAIEEFQ